MVLRDKVFIIWTCMLLILLLRKPAFALEEAIQINGLANHIIKGDAKLAYDWSLSLSDAQQQWVSPYFIRHWQ